MQTSSVSHGRAFNFLTFIENRLPSSEIDILRGQVVQALMITPCVVVSDELPDALFEMPREIVVVEQDLVFQ
jgi:hypothetical protein